MASWGHSTSRQNSDNVVGWNPIPSQALSTADAEGKVDSAIYARRHVLDEGTVAFIMGNHLSHSNLVSNPHAAYLFLERGRGEGAEGYNGLRLYLTKTTGEQTDPKKIEAMRRKERKESITATSRNSSCASKSIRPDAWSEIDIPHADSLESLVCRVAPPNSFDGADSIGHDYPRPHGQTSLPVPPMTSS